MLLILWKTYLLIYIMILLKYKFVDTFHGLIFFLHLFDAIQSIDWHFMIIYLF